MSTTYPEQTAVAQPQPTPATNVAHPQPAPATPEATTEVRRPLVWLLAIVGIALALRLWHLNADFQLDEFSSLYPVAERHVSSPGVMPTSADPLGPVTSWQEVRDRSVLPYGIVNPVPVYHYLLYGLMQMFPVAEWSLRVPSIIAGVGCVLALYLLCRRLFGAEVALVAALFAAVDPLQIGSSILARPYALGNFACLLSFLALLKLLDARKTAHAVVAAVAYGILLALVGYLSPPLLLVVVAHLGLVIYWTRAGGFRHTLDAANQPMPNAGNQKAIIWLAGCGLAAVLLVPVMGYWLEVARFSVANRDTLLTLMPPSLWGFLQHNSAFLLSLLVISVTEYVVASRLPVADANGAGTEGTPAANGTALANGEAPAATPAAPVPPPPPPLPENPDLLWLGRLWLFLPQVVILLLAFGLGLSVLNSRFMSYTSLGGVILLAYWATRNGAREVRLGVAAAVALAMLFWGYTDWSKGYGLNSANDSRTLMAVLDQLNAEGRWKERDALLVRPAVFEAVLLPDRIPQATRDRVEGAILSPYTTLYVNETPKPVFCLGLSLFRGERFGERHGAFFQPQDAEEAALAARLQPYTAFWIYSGHVAQPVPQAFMARMVPWLANAKDADLKVARHRSADEERYFTVKKQSQLGETIDGLSDSQASDFSFLVRVSVLPPDAKK